MRPHGYAAMASTFNPQGTSSQAARYEIRVKGHLDPGWAERLGGLTATYENGGETLLAGLVVDQAALHGLLKAIRDLGVLLISVRRIAPEAGEAELRGSVLAPERN